MRRLALFAFAFGAGLLVCTYLLPATFYIWAASAVLLCGACAVLFLTGNTRLRAIIALCGVLCALSCLGIYDRFKLAPAAAICGREDKVEFTVTGYPESAAYGVRCEAAAEGVKALLYLPEETGGTLAPGDKVTAAGKLRLVTDDQNGTYYRAGGTLIKAFPRGEVRIEKAERLAFKYYPAYAAKKLADSIDRSFHGDTAGFMRALLLGDKSGLGDGVYDTLKSSGLAHMVAVSGLHISFLIGAITKMRLRRRGTAAVCIPALVFFAFMTGCTPSVVRAVIMSVMLLIAPLLGRESDSATALGFALLVTLLQNPYAIQSVSLQLSYASVACIFLFSERIGAFLRGGRKGRIWRALTDSVSLSLSASALTIPISACCFGRISLLAPVSNVLTFWVVSLLFPLGLAVSVIGIFLPGAGSVLGWVLYIPAKYILAVARVISSAAFAQVSARGVPMVCWLVFAYAVFGIMVFTRGWKRKWYVPVCAVTASLCVISLLTAAAADLAGVTFAVLDVGQGQAIVVTSGRETVIIDAGGYGSGADTAVEDYLLSIGRRDAGALLLTHPHKDHAMYAADVLREIHVGNLVLPVSSDDDGIEEEIITAANAAGTEVYRLETASEFDLGGAKFRLFPPTSGKGNELCMAVLISVGDYDILVTGDMPSAQELALTERYDIGDIELLVVGHHGSTTSTSKAFLDAVKPETAIISVGADNSYGHPRKEVLDRLTEAGAEIYRTDINGTITVTVREMRVD